MISWRELVTTGERAIAGRLEGWRSWCRERGLPCEVHAAVARALARGADWQGSAGEVRVWDAPADTHEALRAAGVEWDDGWWVYLG